MRQKLGFTLIELMIVVAIVAILGAIALPSYSDYLRKGRRTEGMRVVQEIRMAEERWRADRPTYGALADVGNPGAGNTYYTFTIGDITATTFTVTATAQGAQADDSQGGVSCASLTVNQAGTKGPPGKEACWRN